MQHETDRLRFLEARDGPQQARAYARRTLRIYRAAVKRGKDGRRSAYGSVYRSALLMSCLDFRAYLSRSPGAG